jgi:MFS family permease
MLQGRIRRRTFIGVGIMFFQQFSGINALLYYAYEMHEISINYSPTVFESFGLSSETAILRASGVINIIQLLASMPVIFTLDLLGRRPLLLVGSVLLWKNRLI